jgi:PadR family transcriptional regulator PadR
MNRSSLYKGCLEPIIMRLLKDNGRMYGYQITQMVKEITGGELKITEGALYPLLHRLEEQGVVETEMENIGNRMRKYYTLTKAGKKQTTVYMDELKTFMHNLNLIMNPKTA